MARRRPRLILCALLAVGQAALAHAEPPRGSLTIERIADIKYPTSPAWSPDGTKVAFLWDAAGKQDLFVVTPASAPVRLTDFAVDSELLVSDIGAFAWTSNERDRFGKDGQLWSVTVAIAKPMRVAGNLGRRRVHALVRPAADCVPRRGQLWIGSVGAKTQRQLTIFRTDSARACPCSRATGDGSRSRRRGGLEPEDLPWNGPMVRSMKNVTRERRAGVVAAQGGDVAWIPVVGATSGSSSLATAR